MAWVREIIATTDRNVYIYIDSEGGHIESALHFASFLRTCHHHVVTVVTGSCMSAAMVILAAGAERFAIPEASLMLHPVGYGEGSEEVLNQYEMKALAADAEEFDEIIYKASIRGSSLSLRTVVKKIEEAESNEWEFTAKEALQWNIITSIGIPFEMPGTMLDTGGK